MRCPNVAGQALSETLLLITPYDDLYISSARKLQTIQKHTLSPSFSVYTTCTQPCDTQHHLVAITISRESTVVFDTTHVVHRAHGGYRHGNRLLNATSGMPTQTEHHSQLRTPFHITLFGSLGVAGQALSGTLLLTTPCDDLYMSRSRMLQSIQHTLS
jgi:hypothetical protein